MSDHAIARAFRALAEHFDRMGHTSLSGVLTSAADNDPPAKAAEGPIDVCKPAPAPDVPPAEERAE
jgi:hypothetical protein